MRWLKWTGIALAIVLVLTAVSFLVWANTPLGPSPEAVAALQSNTKVQVTQGPWLTFQPTGQAPTTGFIFYPGGHVDPRSYAVTAHALAEQGNLVVIVPMPLNLAFTGTERAADVQAAFPDIEHWAIGGHSLGGVFAAQYANEHPDRVEGLALWASYPTTGTNLAGQDLHTLSIYGSEDSGRPQIEAAKPQLSPSTNWVMIPGGNHGQFGDYGAQPGDNPATIDRATQQKQIVDATAALLQSLEADASS